MKNKDKFLIVFVLINNTLSAQTPANCQPYSSSTKTETTCQNGNGISTNPQNLVNEDCPDLKNDFEWRVKHANGSPVPNEYYIAYDENGMVKGLRNPFNDPDNSDYRYLAANHSSNYYPEDGWEMLKVDFGALSNINTGFSVAPKDQPGINTATGGKKLPYMILYNKYTGTFRFFGALLGQNQDYTTIKIELRIPKSNSSNSYQADLKATNLLSIQGESVQSLDQETNENVMVVFATASNSESRFFWFDIPLAYDPCLCNIRSQLDITFSFVKTADIKLNEFQDAIKTQGNPSNFEYGQKMISRVIAAGFATATAISSGGTIVNIQAYTDLINLIRTNPKSNLSKSDKDKLADLENYVNCGGTFAQIIQNNYTKINDRDSAVQRKAALDLVEGTTTFMTALSNKCGMNDNAGTAVTGATSFSGTYTETNLISGTDIKLAMPGSNWSDKKMQINSYDDNGKTIAAYPTYNERLGVFAILETPRVDMFSTTEENCYDNGIVHYKKLLVALKLSENLKFTFNPLINVDESKTIISCRYVGIDPKPFKVKYTSESSLSFNRFSSSSCKLDRDITDINSQNVKLNYNQKNQLTSPFVPLDQFKDLKVVFFMDHIVPFYSDGTHNTHVPTDIIDKIIYIQFKITMTSKDIGKDGHPVTAVYYFNYPMKLNSQFLRSPRIINNEFPLSGPQDFRLGDCGNYKDYFDKTYSPSLYKNFHDGIKNIIIENKEFNSNVVFQGNEELIYDGFVLISAKMSSMNGKKVKIYSSLGFELKPGAEISPDIELIVGLPLNKVPQPPQSYSQVSAFCTNSNKYKAQIFSQDAVKREIETMAERDQANKAYAEKQQPQVSFKIAPNPNSGNFNLTVFNNHGLDYSVEIVDVTGKSIFIKLYNGASTAQFIETTGLADGMYFVKVSCGNHIRTEKLIIAN